MLFDECGGSAGPGGSYGLLARFGAGSGAEWSLFCPGSGIAVDSCVRVIVLLDRPAAGSTFVSAGGVSTVAAAGSDASDAAPAEVGAGDDGSGAVATFGNGLRVSGAGFPQAAKPAATMHRVLAMINGRI